MSIPEPYIEEAKVKLTEINNWFQGQVAQNPSAVLSLVAERGTRIKQEIYADFANRRTIELKTVRDENTLTLGCRAGRGSWRGEVPRDGRSGTIEADNSDWVLNETECRVHVHNNIAGGHSFSVSEDKRKVFFEVHCRGVAKTDMTRGHGAYEATFHAIYQMTDAAINDEINLEIKELGDIIGV